MINVKSIDVSNMCLASEPCQHMCTIYYDDYCHETVKLNGITIANNYYKYLSNNLKEHFKKYFEKNEINKH